KIGAELIANGGFEKLTSDKKGFENWEYSYMDKDKEDTANSNKNGLQVYSFPVGSEDVKDHGSHYIIIESKNYGVAHLKTSVKLYAGQKYLFKFQYNVSSSLKTESGDNDAIGVYLGFLEDKKFSAIENNTSTTSGWITREIYFQPSVTAKYTMVVGIGREDLGGATGKVEFDNLSVKAIKDVPEGENVLKLTPGSAVSDNEAGGVAYTVILTIFAIVLVVGAYYLIRLLQKRNKHIDNAPLFDDDNDGGAPKEVNAVKVKKSFKEFFAPDNLKQTFTSPLAVFIYTLVGAFIIRFILVLTVFGMGDTMIEYGKIGLIIAEDGMSKLYNIHNTNLPTGWLYLLSIFGLIGKALDFTEKSVGMSMLIRIPNIIADIAVCYMIYKMIANNYNYKYSSVIAGTYALLPAMFTASVAWGANISISIAFLIAMLSCMLEKKHLFVPIWFTLGLLFNNFMLIALPVVIGYEIFYCVKDKKAIINIVIASVLSFVVFYCLAIPFGAAYFKADSEI
ncbi:MAG: hypothetical protein K2P12_02265, partial [Clostridia bacterium]|nr:hypothetical protein [Clostridia bacterium]